LENLKVRYHLKDLGENGRLMLKWILGKGVDWIYLAQVRDG
jgi:hypothetical protein